MQTSALFYAKNFGFFKQKGVGPVRTSFGQRGSSIFRDFVRISFMDGPLFQFATNCNSKNSFNQKISNNVNFIYQIVH